MEKHDKYFERSMQHPHTLYTSSKKTGKVREVVKTSIGKAQLFARALLHTKKNEISHIVESDTGLVTDIIEGSADFPKTRKNIYEEELYISLEEVKR